MTGLKRTLFSCGKKRKMSLGKLLHSMFDDNVNYIYLVFVKPILMEMQKVNKCFQSNKTDATCMLKDLVLSINSQKKLIIPSDCNMDIIKDDNFEEYVVKDFYQGYTFQKQIKMFQVHNDSEKSIRECCTNFIVELVKQLKLT